MTHPFLKVNSEIGKLEAILLHRPSKELERITPEYLEELLFEDIPWLKKMQEEHDGFAKVLKDRDVEVFYIEEMLVEVVKNDAAKRALVNSVLQSCALHSYSLEHTLYEFLYNQSPQKLVEFVIAGVEKLDIQHIKREETLSDFVKKDHSFYINPLPNLYFMRDPATVIGNALSINQMRAETRHRESNLLKLLYQYHPAFDLQNVPLVYDIEEDNSLEGGDILVLSEDVIAVGYSKRTSAEGIEQLAQNIFKKQPAIKQIIVVEIPKLRAFMHLDTVFTMVDHDKFTIYPGIEDQIHTFKITPGKGATLKFEHKESLKATLEESLNLSDLTFIPSGGGNPITAAREQWNDSTNTLAIAPGVVVTYGRNEATNEDLRNNGIEVIEIADSELVRGRGGPRCMSMPLRRQDL